MKLMPPKKSTGQKAAQPTQRPPKRGKPAGKGKPLPKKADPDMDGDAGAAETAAAEADEPAARYMAQASRKSRPTVI